MKKILSIFLITLLLPAFASARLPKREFRGAWMHTIGQSQYANQTTDENKAYLRDQLDKLQAAGVNAILWQVRPSADALYDSHYEPWSRYLTANGQPPVPYWDPLQFMIEEAHARGMELHAWLNPYRVTTAKNQTLPSNHIYHKEPWRFVTYEGDGKLYFDPGLPENREFIATVVMDIVERYDVDGIHFDDYFYPYPANKKDFPDAKSYAKYGNGMDKGDWRRQNVDQLISLVNAKIKKSKPWVRFGISPFGIWRNQKSDPRGSETNGLQNYDDLYADALLWAEKGWIDYLIPQLYWELEHKVAPYGVLVEWWDQAVDPKCQLYIGQSVEKTMEKPDLAPSTDTNQLNTKVTMTRNGQKIQGNCWWPGYSITKNSKGVASLLANKHQEYPALVPEYPALSKESPKPVKKLRIDNKTLRWTPAERKGAASDPVKFVVYRFNSESEIDFDNPENIVAITPNAEFPLKKRGIYYVTVIDRVNIESNPSNKVVY